jgi:hypothetical protein
MVTFGRASRASGTATFTIASKVSNACGSTMGRTGASCDAERRGMFARLLSSWRAAIRGTNSSAAGPTKMARVPASGYPRWVSRARSANAPAMRIAHGRSPGARFGFAGHGLSRASRAPRHHVWPRHGAPKRSPASGSALHDPSSVSRVATFPATGSTAYATTRSMSPPAFQFQLSASPASTAFALKEPSATKPRSPPVRCAVATANRAAILKSVCRIAVGRAVAHRQPSSASSPVTCLPSSSAPLNVVDSGR